MSTPIILKYPFSSRLIPSKHTQTDLSCSPATPHYLTFIHINSEFPTFTHTNTLLKSNSVLISHTSLPLEPCHLQRVNDTSLIPPSSAICKLTPFTRILTLTSLTTSNSFPFTPNYVFKCNQPFVLSHKVFWTSCQKRDFFLSQSPKLSHLFENRLRRAWEH